MPARYRKISKIADGGMAEIFLALQHGAEGFERRVVLKQILAALLADPKFRNLLVDEALVAMSLNHSNIAQVLDLGQSKGRYFLVLELVDGWDLNRILAPRRETPSTRWRPSWRSTSWPRSAARLATPTPRPGEANRWASSTATSARTTCSSASKAR